MNWITPTSGRIATGDVTVGLSRHGKKFSASVTFRNRKGDMLSKNGRITFAIEDNRAYFREDDYGFKMLETSPETKRFQTTRIELIEFARKYRGNYPLQKDKMNGLWYIEAVGETDFDKYK